VYLKSVCGQFDLERAVLMSRSEAIMVARNDKYSSPNIRRELCSARVMIIGELWWVPTELPLPPYLKRVTAYAFIETLVVVRPLYSRTVGLVSSVCFRLLLAHYPS
jgi:hypothetical protein